MPPSLVSLSPADMSELDILQPVSFSIIDTDGTPTSSVLAWVKYANRSDKILAYDSVDFSFPFEANSELERPLGDDSNIYFRLLPEEGWEANISELRIEFQDNGNGGGASATASNIVPPVGAINTPDFDPTVPIAFDITADTAIQITAAWAQFATSEERIMIYETDGFTENFDGSSTISGAGVTRSFSLFENGGWRARPVNLFCFTEDSNGTVTVLDILLP